MEPPDGCPAEVYDIMRQVYIKFLSVVIHFVSYCHILLRCYFLTGMGFTARKETEFS